MVAALRRQWYSVLGWWHGERERTPEEVEQEWAVRMRAIEDAARYLDVVAQTEALAAAAQRRDGGLHGSHQSPHRHDMD